MKRGGSKHRPAFANAYVQKMSMGKFCSEENVIVSNNFLRRFSFSCEYRAKIQFRRSQRLEGQQETTMDQRYKQVNAVTFKTYIKSAIDQSVLKAQLKKSTMGELKQTFSMLSEAVLYTLVAKGAETE